MTANAPAAERLGRRLCAAGLMLAVALGCWRVTDPWEVGLRGANGGQYIERYVQSALQVGLSATRLMPVSFVEPVEPPVLHWNPNHPALYPLICTATCALFGTSEAVIRLTTLLLFLPAVPALFFLLRRLVGPTCAGAAALLFAAAPFGGYFGPAPVQDGPVVAASLLTELCFVRWLDRSTRGRAVALGSAWIWAGLLDWPAYFTGAVLLGFALLADDRRRALRAVAALAVLSLVPIGLFLLHGTWVFGSLAADFAAVRATVAHAFPQPVTWSAVAEAFARHVREQMTIPILLLSVIGVLLAWRRGAPGRRAVIVAALLAAPGVLNCLLFREHVLVHDYWPMHALPGLALAAALPLALVAGELGGEPATRAARGTVLVVTVAAAAFGATTTVLTIETNRSTLYRDVGTLIASRFGRGDIVASNVNLGLSNCYCEALLLGPATDPAAVDLLLATYAPPHFRGHLAFLLPASARGSPLARALERHAAPERLGDWLLYGLRAASAAPGS